MCRKMAASKDFFEQYSDASLGGFSDKRCLLSVIWIERNHQDIGAFCDRASTALESFSRQTNSANEPLGLAGKQGTKGACIEYLRIMAIRVQ
jgi:hypothetical protein